MTEEQKQKIIEALDGLKSNQQTEDTHAYADKLLCTAVAAAGYPDIADAFWRAQARCGFCYC